MERQDGAGRPDRVLGWLDEDEPPPPEEPPIPVRRDPWAAARGGLAAPPVGADSVPGQRSGAGRLRTRLLLLAALLVVALGAMAAVALR